MMWECEKLLLRGKNHKHVQNVPFLFKGVGGGREGISDFFLIPFCQSIFSKSFTMKMYKFCNKNSKLFFFFKILLTVHDCLLGFTPKCL